MIYWQLFLSFLRIGLFAVGGAYTFLPLIEREVVEKYHWLSKDEFLEVLAMVKIFPGAISIKYASYTGYKVGGIFGLICANLGNLLAPTLILIAAARLYYKYKDESYMQPVFIAMQLSAFAMIIAVAFKIINPSQLMNIKGMIIVLFSFTLFIYTRIHPAVVIVLAAIVGFWLK